MRAHFRRPLPSLQQQQAQAQQVAGLSQSPRRRIPLNLELLQQPPGGAATGMDEKQYLQQPQSLVDNPKQDSLGGSSGSLDDSGRSGSTAAAIQDATVRSGGTGGADSSRSNGQMRGQQISSLSARSASLSGSGQTRISRWQPPSHCRLTQPE